jgi:hypothetical protein
VIYRTIARNTATASTNKIHDDAVARQYGFGGGLVPGVTIFAYMTRPVVEKLGLLSFMWHGRMGAKFLKPVYDGDEIEVELTEDLQLEVRNRSGVVCAAGSIIYGSPRSIRVANGLASYRTAELPDPVPVASEATFAAQDILGTLRGEFTAESARSFLEVIQDDSELYRDKHVAHPGWLLTWANLILVSNFRLGPWIHTSSDVYFLTPLAEGDPIETRGRVVKTYDRGGHRFVELDIALLSKERPVMQARHVAIYEPRLPEVTAS